MRAILAGAGLRAILTGGRKATQLARYSNDHELAVRACKELELILVTSFQAPGRRDARGWWRATVHEKIQRARLPCGNRLPEHILLQMRTIQGVRNALTHDYDTNCIANRAAFLQAFDEIESYQAEVELSPYYGILRMLHSWRRLALRWTHSSLERVRLSIRIHGENEQAAAKKKTTSVHGGGT